MRLFNFRARLDSLGNIADSINQIDSESDESYELVIQDGIIYMSNTVTGQMGGNELLI